VWCRATLRARIDAARAGRPARTQPIAGAAAIGLLLVLAVLVKPALTAARTWVVQAVAAADPSAAGVVVTLMQWSVPLIAAAGVLLVVAGVSVYLALPD
jgi:hypothetical protein